MFLNKNILEFSAVCVLYRNSCLHSWIISLLHTSHFSVLAPAAALSTLCNIIINTFRRRISSIAFPDTYGLLSQAGALAMLAAGILYIAFSAKMEERERSAGVAVNVLSGEVQNPEQKERISPYQPPTAHV